MARGVIKELMSEDCQGKLSITQTSNGLFTDGLPLCTLFKKNMTLTHIDGYSIKTHGALAYDHVHQKCKNKAAKVKVSSLEHKKGLNFPCPQNLPEREAFVQLLTY